MLAMLPMNDHAYLFRYLEVKATPCHCSRGQSDNGRVKFSVLLYGDRRRAGGLAHVQCGHCGGTSVLYTFLLQYKRAAYTSTVQHYEYCDIR